MKRYFNLILLAFVWIAVFGLFSFFVPASFPTADNVETLLRQTAAVGFAAIGMTFIIITGGIDLSVGSVMALVTVVIAWVLRLGQPPLVAALAGVLVALACGGLNGLCISRMKIVPFIVTLGTMEVIRGLAKGWAGEQKIDAPLTMLCNFTATLEREQRWMLVPGGLWILALVAVAAALILKYTTFGRHVIAIGSNVQAARLCGVRVERTTLLAYLLGGFFTGMAGLTLFSRLSVGDPTAAMGHELDVIAAVVIGGGSMSGGEGSILGSLIGALIMSTIRAGCSQMGLPNWVQEIVTGTLIVGAVALDRLRVARQK